MNEPLLLLSFRYVGLCASVKIVALAIFAIDWWLVRKRRHMDKLKPLNVNDPVIGSIISLDKCKPTKSINANLNLIFMHCYAIVFEEKLSNADATHFINFKRFGNDAKENQLCHSRNNSRTIQLEYG